MRLSQPHTMGYSLGVPNPLPIVEVVGSWSVPVPLHPFPPIVFIFSPLSFHRFLSFIFPSCFVFFAFFFIPLFFSNFLDFQTFVSDFAL